MKLTSKGIAHLAVLVVAVVAVIALAGWYVWNKNQPDKPAQSNSPSSSQSKEKAPAADPYAGWKEYNNATYGISFKYPADWRLEEASGDPSGSSTKLEHSLTLQRSEEEKYDDTVLLEIFDQPIAELEAVYDRQFEQTPENPFSKNRSERKGKDSIFYQSGGLGTPKVYLFSVGAKTYVVSSIGEELNLQIEPSYWDKFQKTYDSLEITKS